MLSRTEMRDLMGSSTPVYVLRTAGGIYLVTATSWGKVCALRESNVPSESSLQKRVGPVKIMAGTDSRNPRNELYRPVELDDLQPGAYGARLQGRGPHNWTRTSPVLAVYVGVITDQPAPQRPYLMIDSNAAWYVSTDHESIRFLRDGFDAPPAPCTPAESLVDSAFPIIVQIHEERQPATDMATYLRSHPGWTPAFEAFATTLAEHGTQLRAIVADPVMSARPDVLLSAVPIREVNADALPSGEVTTALESLSTAMTVCQDCGTDPAKYAAIPSPYVLMHYWLCARCRAVRMQEQRDLMSPDGGLTPLFTVGEGVRVWRSAEHLHVVTGSGYTRLARLDDREYGRTTWPGPHLLELPDEYAAFASLPDDADGSQSIRAIADLSEALPGMTVATVSFGVSGPTFTILDTFHGVGAETIDDEHDYLVTVTGVRPGSDRAWLLEHGVASRILTDGWESAPDESFTFSDLFTDRHAEVAIIRLDTILRGASSSRAGFDLFAPGWTENLERFLEAVDKTSKRAATLTDADVSPLTGIPMVRLSGVRTAGMDACFWNLRSIYRRFISDCLRQCAVCGGPGRLTSLPASNEQRGSVRRCLCLIHEEQEYEEWNT